MAHAHNEPSSLRFGRRESARLVVALLLSLFAHLAVWGGYETGKKAGLWQKLHPPAWLKAAAKKYPLSAQIVQPTEPNIFVDVSHADTDAPKQPKYYSNKNSRAANPDTANASVAQINGQQKDVPKTEDVPRVPAKPKDAPKVEDAPQLPKLQPSMPAPQPKIVQQEPVEKPQTPGETELLKSKTNVVAQTQTQTQTQTQVPAPPPRPRTIKSALAQQDQLPGQQMQQAGGVARHALWSSLDAKATPFGDYDRAIIEAVSQRWYDLLDSRRFAQDRSGKVILRFKMKPDGTIIEMQTLENTVGELLGYLCHEAIEEAAPFAKWPPDMVRMIGANYRDITFTFYYY